MIVAKNKDDAKEMIKQMVPCTRYLTKAPKGDYICMYCGSGTGKNKSGAMTYYKDDNHAYCHACNKSADCIDLYMQANGVDYNDALAQLMEENNIILESDSKSGKNDAAKSPQGDEKADSDNISHESENGLKTANTASEKELKNYMDYYLKCKDHVSDQVPADYLKSRGIDQDTAARYWIGYDPATKFIIIPCSNTFYVARNTDSNSDFRYNNPKGVPVELFNKKTLYDDSRPVFVTEGLFNALSIIEAGGQAIALNSAGNYKKLLTMLEDKPTESPLIISLDNDPTGEKDTKSLSDGLDELGQPYITANIAGDLNDVNDAWTADPDKVKQSVAAAERRAVKPDNTKDYILQDMKNEIREIRRDSRRKTGFANLDYQLHSLYSGLYFVGGISSVGKTSWAWQLADQLAERGEHVLFFSLEMSRLEMISKSISRYTAIIDQEHAVTGAQIRMGAAGELIDQAKDMYIKKVGDRVSVIQGDFNYDVLSVGDYVDEYIKQNNVRPTLIIDYLQILPATPDPDTGRKNTDPRVITNENVTYLKRLSRRYKIPVVVMSALNRSNYTAPIDFESFRESSGIEYSADAIFGLQLAAIHDPVFAEDNKKTVEKRERIRSAKLDRPRVIELACLKNRWGISSFSCTFNYYPQFDLFQVPDDDMPKESEREEWQHIDDGEQISLPFD